MGKNINDIDARFSVDYTDFKTGISTINRGLRETRSEFYAVSSGMDDWRSSTEGVTAKLKSLDTTLVGQKKKLELLRKEYEKIVEENGESSKAAQNFRIKLNNQEAAVNRVEKEIKQLNTTLNKMQQEESESVQKTKQLTSEIDKLNKMSDKLSSFGNNMSMYVTVPIIGAMAAMTNSALNLEATEAKYNTVFGNMVDDMQEYIDEWQTLVPATEVGARNIASGIQDLYVPMGFYRDEAQGMTESTMTLVGALANFNSAEYTSADIASKFNSAITGQYKPLKDIGIVTSKASVEQRAYALGLDMSTESAQKQSMAVALLDIAYEQSADALAAFNEESLDTKTKLNIALNELKDVGAEFGQEFIPIITRGVEALNDMIDRLQDMSPASRKTVLAVAGIVASIGPLTKGVEGIVTGIKTIKTIKKSLNMAATATEIGATATATSSLAAGVSAALGPIGVGIGLVATLVTTMGLLERKLEKTTEGFKEGLVSATDFYSTLEDTEPIDEFNNKLKETTDNTESVNSSVNSINTDIEFKINEQSIATARDTIIELREAHDELMLTMSKDSVSGITSTINTTLDNILSQRKDNLLPGINNIFNDESLSSDEMAQKISGLSSNYASFEAQVNTARESIISYYNSIESGQQPTAEMIDTYKENIQVLKDLGISEELLMGTTKTLGEQAADIYGLFDAGAEKTGGFTSTISQFVETLGDELVPVQDAVTGAMDTYNSTLETSIEKIDADIKAKKDEIEADKELGETYDSLFFKYDAAINNYSAYIASMLNGDSVLTESQRQYVDSLKTKITTEEEMALLQVGLGDQYSAYVDFMKDKTIDLNYSREDSLAAFISTLSEEDQAILKSYDSYKHISLELIEASEEYKDSAIAHQEELSGMDRAELISEADASAQATALETMRLAVEEFATANGLDLPAALATLQTSLSENGITLDTELTNMITNLSEFSTNLNDTTGTAGTDSFAELIAPFEEAEVEGENLISNMIAGIEKGVEENIEAARDSGEETLLATVDGAETGAGTNSPSWKTALIGKYMIQGLVQGLNNNASKAYATAQTIANNIVAIIDSAWDINSPSKVGVSKGAYLLEGISLGMKQQAANAYKDLNQIMSNMTAIASNKISYSNQSTVSNRTYYNSRNQTVAPRVTISSANDGPNNRAAANQYIRDIVAAVANGW